MTSAKKEYYDDEPMFDEASIDSFYLSLLSNLKDIQYSGYGNTGTTRGLIVRTKEELDKYYRENYCIDDEEESVASQLPSYHVEVYQKIVEYIEQGGMVMFKDVDYSDDTTEKIIKLLTERDQYFEILKKE